MRLRARLGNHMTNDEDDCDCKNCQILQKLPGVLHAFLARLKYELKPAEEEILFAHFMAGFAQGVEERLQMGEKMSTLSNVMGEDLMISMREMGHYFSLLLGLEHVHAAEPKSVREFLDQVRNVIYPTDA